VDEAVVFHAEVVEAPAVGELGIVGFLVKAGGMEARAVIGDVAPRVRAGGLEAIGLYFRALGTHHCKRDGGEEWNEEEQCGGFAHGWIWEGEFLSFGWLGLEGRDYRAGFPPHL
jgi:hypothetical protein